MKKKLFRAICAVITVAITAVSLVACVDKNKPADKFDFSGYYRTGGEALSEGTLSVQRSALSDLSAGGASVSEFYAPEGLYKVSDNGGTGIFDIKKNEFSVPSSTAVVSIDDVISTSHARYFRVKSRDAVNSDNYVNNIYMSDGLLLASFSTAKNAQINISVNEFRISDGLGGIQFYYAFSIVASDGATELLKKMVYIKVEDDGGFVKTDEIPSDVPGSGNIGDPLPIVYDGKAYGLDGYKVRWITRNGNYEVVVSDSSDKEVANAILPQNAVLVSVSQGCMCYVTQTVLPADSKDYDFFIGASAYKFNGYSSDSDETLKIKQHVYSYDLLKGKSREVKFDYALTDAVGDLKNVDGVNDGSLWTVGIIEKSKSLSPSKTHLVLCGKGEVEADLPDAAIAEDLTYVKLSGERYLAYGEDGAFILDKYFNRVADVSAVKSALSKRQFAVDGARSQIIAWQYSSALSRNCYGALNFDGTVSIPFVYDEELLSGAIDGHAVARNLFSDELVCVKLADATQKEISFEADDVDLSYAGQLGLAILADRKTDSDGEYFAYRLVDVVDGQNVLPEGSALFSRGDLTVRMLTDGSYVVKYAPYSASADASAATEYYYLTLN